MDENKSNQLSAYIMRQLQSGLTPDDIANQLRVAGWQEVDIATGFRAAQSYLQPTPLPGPQSQPIVTAVENTQPEEPAQVSLPAPIKRTRLKTGWLLFKQSLRILRGYPGLIKYPLFSFGISFVLFVAVCVAYIYDMDNAQILSAASVDQYGEPDRTVSIAGLALGVTYYLITAFVTYFFSTALSAHVLGVFKGQNNSTGYFMRIARSKAGAIATYALINVTIGFILRTIAERFRLLGWIVSKVLGALWSLATSFVVPVIADSSDNGFVAVKRSLGLFKANWEETIVGRVSLGTLAFLVYILTIVPLFVILAVILGSLFNAIGAFIALLLFILTFIAFIVVEAAATQILNTGLYYYARYRVIPPDFDPELLASVFIPKKKK
jgi:hypothetical protein